ncbi:anti-sigma regulatory factor (Ser/Thr protein kinase) [Halopolyspora algeriensis]|uniref:Anti-sigma regulatory factor (Ser/Thr protein kinase) n=1 Tax=Halopolyspora algeriensis TaxID=1500506 RepID=A0A368VR17_9ACTN|nr:ATP-binding protein [Halopolyspora algeriensis]RCW43302.1 anti-sigma regulatory factor (Ser/Thr protein kinase) [Halopolyspora algeriensis]TQM56361.1 anti-sigma regulatory factor (Ser/Thr protein kinase) [Halopolyspora algeriensis]
MDTDGEVADKHGGGSGETQVTDLRFPAVPAEPERLPELRHTLVEWAERTGMAAEQVETLALAAYEALANAAVHAYPDGDGVLDVHASHRPDSAQVEVTVTDYGRWRLPPSERGGTGGRGLVLIRNLADHAEVIAETSGTTVRMAWALTPQAETARLSLS